MSPTWEHTHDASVGFGQDTSWHGRTRHRGLQYRLKYRTRQPKAGVSPGLTGNQQQIVSVRNETVKGAGVVRKIKTLHLLIRIPLLVRAYLLQIQNSVFCHVSLILNCFVVEMNPKNS